MLSRKTLENEIPEKPLSTPVKKTDLVASVARRGGFGMRAIAKELGISRSNLINKL
jgi:hypothetical protein